LRWQAGRSSRPLWLWFKSQDLIRKIYAQQDRILRDGEVRWAAVVQANELAFEPNDFTVGAQVIYAPRGDVPLTVLLQSARRAFALKGTSPADAAERKLANMLTDEMERALDWPLPATIAGDAHIVTTIVMLPRKHLPGRCLALNYMPILSHPQTLLAVLVPQRYWPRELVAQWKTQSSWQNSRC
jgi:hypothetical protein